MYLNIVQYNLHQSWGLSHPSPTAPGIPAGWRWVHLPDNLLDSHSTTRWTLPYCVVLAAVDGDWYDAAQIHRKWAVAEASWTTYGTTRQRAASGDVPEWFLKTPFWVEGALGGTAVSYWTEVLTESVGLKDLAIFWPLWNTQEFSTCLPIFSPLPGFSKAVVEMQGRGIHAVPYINGRLFDFRSNKPGNDTVGTYLPSPGNKTDHLRFIYEINILM